MVGDTVPKDNCGQQQRAWIAVVGRPRACALAYAQTLMIELPEALFTHQRSNFCRFWAAALQTESSQLWILLGLWDP